MADDYGQFDVQSAKRIGAVVRFVEGMMRGGGSQAGGKPRVVGDSWGFGVLDQLVTAGVLISGETVTPRLGPAWDTDDTASGAAFPIHHASDDMASGTYVTWSRHRGKVYVQPLECP